MLRALDFPAYDELRDEDEVPYMSCGLLVAEGMAPPVHFAPAGPQTWLIWLRSMGLSARYVVFPTAEELKVPAVVRPFTALNHALFDQYRDFRPLRREFLLIAVIVSLLAVAAGFEMGRRGGGTAGAVLAGGLVAFVPVLLDNTLLSKSYGMAWSLAVVAASLAVLWPRRAALASAVCFGLSIGSRIEMLELLPLYWILLWPGRRSVLGWVWDISKYATAAAITTLLVAPWLLTELLGNLRAIATIRFAPPPGGMLPLHEVIREFAWGQGLGIALVLVAAGTLAALRRPAHPPDGVAPTNPGGGDEAAPLTAQTGVRNGRVYGRGWRWAAVGYVGLLLLSLKHSTAGGIRHHGPVLVALIIAAPLALGPLFAAWPRLTCWAVTAAVLVPLGQAVRDVRATRMACVTDQATNWVEANVPAGSILYFPTGVHDPLPTPQSANRMWDEVAGREGAERKFRSGLDRFGLKDDEIPRAMSEENMTQERGNARGTYILGSRSAYAGPRFDERCYGRGPVFGVQDVSTAFARTGGVVIWRGNGPMPGTFEPIKTWVNGTGRGTYVYCSPDLRARLTPDAVPTMPGR